MRTPSSQLKTPRHCEELFWSIRAIHSHFEAIHGAWAECIGVSLPQFTMMLALRDYDPDRTGLPVKEVARILGVDPTFATTQSKLLETMNLISRNSSSDDARVVRLSLSDLSLKHLAALSQRQRKLNEYIYSELTERGRQAFAMKASSLKIRMEKASVIALMNLGD
jgi:DNA-binding MarR family transcriptional regulator